MQEKQPSDGAGLTIDPVTLEILWSRLIAATDESATALVRASFSTNVREANDFACALLDPDGGSVAENTIGIPSFVGIMPITMKHALRKFPLESWQPGDVVITNDPWLATGHLPDITVLAPVFHRGRLVAFAGNIAHAQDVGGAIFSADAREVFEEGIRIPLCRFFKAGQPVEEVFELVEANLRVPEQVMGDLYAQISATEVCGSRLIELLEEYGIDDLGPLARAVQTGTERAMRQAIEEIPDGVYTHTIETDGYERPTRIRATVTVRGSEIEVDYEGSSEQSERGVNCVMNYTYAYTAYPIKCAIDPLTPKNEGSYRPIKVKAPLGSILNGRFPCAVSARHLTVHFLYAAVFGALAPVLPSRIIADAGSTPNLRVVVSGIGYDGERFLADPYANGGLGARPDRDGLPCTCFPSNRSTHSIELMESRVPLLFHQKQMITDSGGPGRFRGGLGQEIGIELRSGQPGMISIFSDRMQHPALGLSGGLPGAPAEISMSGGKYINPKGRTRLDPGDVVTIRCPGGGGYGPPEERDRWRVLEDVRNGVVSPDAAAEVYRLGVGSDD